MLSGPQNVADSTLEVGVRLKKEPSPRLIASAFARELHSQKCLSRAVNWVDLAHTLTLAERGIIPESDARSLLSALLSLEVANDFSLSPEFGDLYTNREEWIAKHTVSVGWLGTARARREALTTAWHLLVCDELISLAEALGNTARTLCALSVKHTATLMPDYTYLQPAQPTSFGHYLQSFAWPILRDLQRIQALYRRLDLCPAGIGSTNGSITNQDRRRQSMLLGFQAPVRHARDAMWQPDLAMETVSVAVTALVSLDRLAEDLMMFASPGFGFIQLSDRHARASKIMPQKRNPYSLAYIRAISNRLIGLQTGIAAANRVNSAQIDSRLFAYGDVPEGVHSATEAVLLFEECIDELVVNDIRTASRMDDSLICATDLAERLMIATRVSYREAYRVVGNLINTLETQQRRLADATVSDIVREFQIAGFHLDGIDPHILSTALDPVACVDARSDVGCAAPAQVRVMADDLAAEILDYLSFFIGARELRGNAVDTLLATTRSFIGSEK